jgi:hypothetical protein
MGDSRSRAANELNFGRGGESLKFISWSEGIISAGAIS